MRKFKITEKEYEKLKDMAAVTAQISSDEYSFDRTRTYDYHNDFPSVKDLEDHRIGEEMDEFILLYLIYYGEEKCVDEDKDIWVPIYEPPEERRKEFAPVRSHIRRLIRQRVDIV